jgi:hypothetical protein
MPEFNLRKQRGQQRQRPLDLLNRRVREEERLRPSDVSDLSDEEIQGLAKRLGSEAMTREARHGTADGWFPQDSGYSPYKTSPLVNANPEFGHRWRENFPGPGDRHINDDKDKPKDWKGKQDDIGKPEGPGTGLPTSIQGPKYIVRVRINHGDNPDAVQKQMEQACKSKCGRDSGSVYVEVETYEEAVGLQRRVPRSMVEPK